MTKSGILQTRSHLSQIVNKVMRGHEHIILRKNVAVAKIVPVQETLVSQAKDLIARTKDIRAYVQKTSLDEIHQWKIQGRRP